MFVCEKLKSENVQKRRKKPIIKIFLAFLFADKSYTEGKYIVDFLEILGFIGGLALSVAIIGVPLALWISYRKQKRLFKYLREYEALPGGND